MNIQKLSIPDLNPARYNPRKQLKPGDAEFEKLKRSIENFGYVELIVVNGKNQNTVISGHQRLNVLKHLGYTEAECVLVEMDEADEKALNIAMNKVSGEWNKELLADLIKDLQSMDYDIGFTGFDPPEIDQLFSDVHDKNVQEDEFDIDAALENGEEPLVKAGDVWLLGRHRLLCGDATNPEDMNKLMAGKKANICVTDPPYNCDYSGGTGMKIQNDNMSDGAFKAFLLDSFRHIYENLVDGGAFYCFHSDAEKVNFFNATVEAGFHYSTTCIWVKNSLVLGRMDYQMRHEPIIYAFKNTAKHNWYGGRKLTTVWEFDRPTRSVLHPTSKPLDLIGYPTRNSSLENSIVLDLFGGSGSTLIASEQLNRICYMMELDPKYATVIVKRYYQYSLEHKNSDEAGTDADVFLLRNGEKIAFADVSKPEAEVEEELLK